MTIRQPRSIEAATELLEQFAKLDGQIATIEAERQDAITALNARCDTAANDLLEQRAAIRAKLQPWWAREGEQLTAGKRKSIELGGCMIGTRAGKVSLAVAGAEGELIERLQALRWAKALVRVTSSLDKRAILGALDGKRSAELTEMGFSKDAGETLFFVQRTEQAGTRGAG